MAKERGFQPHPPWLNKCIQLYETYMVRHGIMVVGPAGSGAPSVCIYVDSLAMLAASAACPAMLYSCHTPFILLMSDASSSGCHLNDAAPTSCAGKSSILECLAAALTELGTKHVIWRMNPKAITAPQVQRSSSVCSLAMQNAKPIVSSCDHDVCMRGRASGPGVTKWDFPRLLCSEA